MCVGVSSGCACIVFGGSLLFSGILFYYFFTPTTSWEKCGPHDDYNNIITESNSIIYYETGNARRCVCVFPYSDDDADNNT